MKVVVNIAVSVLFLNGWFTQSGLVGAYPLNAKYTITAKTPTRPVIDTLIVKKCQDFKLTGNGENIEWGKTNWSPLIKLDAGASDYLSRFKMLYSDNGIYVLFNGEDDKITTQAQKDFAKIYEGDAFEVFFHPDVRSNKYFEFEINQLNKVLMLTISKRSGMGNSWIPWQFENKKQMVTKVTVARDGKGSNNLIRSWSAEVFLPYGLLDLLGEMPPKTRTVWNANFCRLDYDSGDMIKWSWSPKIKSSFHELKNFLPIKFE